MRVPLMVGALLAFAALGGCSGGGGTATPTPAGATAVQCGAAATGSAVNIANFAFNPASVTVAVNSAVTWTNNDATAHTVSFDSGPNCGTVSAGASMNVLFAVAGEYKYHCNIHRSMTATVIVQ